MKLLIVALALVASAYAYSIEDIPEHMRDRLDRFVALKKQWEEKWTLMSESEQKHYEQVLLERLENLPQIARQKTHERLESMPREHLTRLLDYLRRRFPNAISGEQFDNEVEEVESFINALPEMIREKLAETLVTQNQKATAYNGEEMDTEFDFPDIPEIVDVPEAVGYSQTMPEEIRNRLDEFLSKREDWRHKWEKLPAEKREVLEAYINEKLK